MKNKVICILSSLGAIAVAGGSFVGVTYSLFTSDESSTISVNAGKVDTSVSISNLATYSGVWNGSTESYDSVATTTLGEFSNGGTAVLNNDVLTLDKISPMDKITCKVDIANNSNIAINYRTIVTAETDTGLFGGLKIKINDVSFDGTTAVSSWTPLAVGGSIQSLLISIELPEDAGVEYANTSCSIKFRAQAVQGNAHIVDAPSDGVNLWTAFDLVNFGKKINQGSQEFAGKTIYFCDDIDLLGIDWEPIYAWTKTLTNSTIDGMNHTIKNMNTSDEGTAGFINGLACTLTIKDLTFENAHVGYEGATKAYCGVVVGKMYSDLTLKNVSIINSRVDCNHQCGMFVGYGEGNKQLVFENCKVVDGKIGGGDVCSAGTLFGCGYVIVTIKDCVATNVELDSDTGDWGGDCSYFERTGMHWVATTYDYSSGVTPTLVGSNVETNVRLVDSLD